MAVEKENVVADILYFVLGAILLWIVVNIINSIKTVKEREAIVIEQLGKYSRTLSPGLAFIVPFFEKPRTYQHRFLVTENGRERLKLEDSERISLQNEVVDFPRQEVISRDNAIIHLDVVMNYAITNPVKKIYSVTNLPHMLSKLLQAQIRNVAGTMEVDRLIEGDTQIDEVVGQMSQITASWGVVINFIKVQRIDMCNLKRVLESKKKEELSNRKVVNDAKGKKQTMIIEAEGNRDSMIKEAEGRAQQIISQARGRGQALVNKAQAQKKEIQEVGRALSRVGEDAAKYLLALKYLETLTAVAKLPGTRIEFLPKETAFVQTARAIGMNTGVAMN